MDILKVASIFLIMLTPVKAQDTLTLDTEGTVSDPDMNQMMCRSLEHRFNRQSHECIYCAHGLHYKENSSDCIGIPDILGKCMVNDHYQPNTQKCSYCGAGYTFHPDLKECMPGEKFTQK